MSRAGVVLLLGSLLLTAAPAGAQAASLARWTPLVRAHCQPLGVPVRLAQAVILTESGGNPYALHIQTAPGGAQYPATHAQAVRVVQAALPQTTSIDLGLMQLHLREVRRRARQWRVQGVFQDFWRQQAGTPGALLDPVGNIQVGCVMLAQALAAGGPPWQQVGRYHSPTPWRQWAYAERVARWLTRLPR